MRLVNLHIWIIIKRAHYFDCWCEIRLVSHFGNAATENATITNDSKAAMLQSAAIYTGVRLSRALSRRTRGLSTFDTRQPAKFKSPDSNFCRRLHAIFYAFLCLLWSCVVFLSIYVVLLRAMWLLIFICYFMLFFWGNPAMSRRKQSNPKPLKSESFLLLYVCGEFDTLLLFFN